MVMKSLSSMRIVVPIGDNNERPRFSLPDSILEDTPAAGMGAVAAQRNVRCRFLSCPPPWTALAGMVLSSARCWLIYLVNHRLLCRPQHLHICSAQPSRWNIASCTWSPAKDCQGRRQQWMIVRSACAKYGANRMRCSGKWWSICSANLLDSTSATFVDAS